MGCLVLPCYVMKRRRRRSTRPHLGYHRLHKSNFGRNDSSDAESSLVKVVAGKERREFLVDPFVLEENPFRTLIEKGGDSDDDEDGDGDHGKKKRVIFVDVDAILFEHLLWLMYNDCSSLFKLNVEEILDFYAQDF
ncbi:Auxin responsive SAUR protein [Cucumis melo var. makuwa]|nr:Auxin responsive SAUR protein [Cucumis melo var. makuwa]TYK31158.1 Auxin responsive SAUR protein [Cucumis melo var. makuwa]